MLLLVPLLVTMSRLASPSESANPDGVRTIGAKRGVHCWSGPHSVPSRTLTLLLALFDTMMSANLSPSRSVTKTPLGVVPTRDVGRCREHPSPIATARDTLFVLPFTETKSTFHPALGSVLKDFFHSDR